MAGSSDRRSSALTLLLVLVLVVVVTGMWAFVFMDNGQYSGTAEAASTSAASSSPSASTVSASAGPSSSSATSPEGDASMDAAREAFAEGGSQVLVLGDGTGDGWDEWAFLWAEEQGMPGAMWMTETENGYSGSSESTRLWSGGMPQTTADYPVEHWDAMWPSSDPDLVLLNYGHVYSSTDAATQSMEALRQAIAYQAPETPIVVLLQNPQADDANADVREAIGSWAQGAGLPTIDVAAAFAESDQAPENLRLDEMHPSEAGSQLWAQTVDEALTG
ncbi:SGNH/GDSL hydrolase family protein [Janibacter alittae]|uniref:SGNH/GDSL hydrolase family protein n=1 Tax=Janibacter alittae TaxID=3115209 RepID=A0ABZ2MJN0_9MICO